MEILNRQVIPFVHDRWFATVREAHIGNMHHGKQKTWQSLGEKCVVVCLFVCLFVCLLVHLFHFDWLLG